MNAYAGQTIEPILTNAPQNIDGTLTIAVRSLPDETELVAASTAGITEYAQGDGTSNYQATVVIPDDAEDGLYEIVWNNSTVEITENLDIGAISAQPSGTDLTTLAAVREFLQKQGDDSGQDDELQALITAASGLINTHIAYFPAQTAAAKTFVWRGGPLSLHPYFLRSATTVVIDPDETTSTTLTTSDYRLRPKPARLGAYRWLKLPGQTLTPGYEREMVITGNWGLNPIPADVVHWTNVAVAIWLRRDVAAFSTTLRLEEDRLERPDKLPTAVSAGLARYADPRPM